MMKDNINMVQMDHDTIAMMLSSSDPSCFKMTGEITDKIYKNGVLIEERVGHNIIVNSFMKLVMAMLKGNLGYNGIQYWAVGSGQQSWDNSPVEPEINATRLTAEIGRVSIPSSEITFVDAGGVTSSSPTNIIQIKHTFGPNDCNGKWREFALFGGNASPSPNSGMMINKKHHGVITKTADISIERTMKFTLSLV